MHKRSLWNAFINEIGIGGKVNKWLLLLIFGIPFVYTILFGYTYKPNVLGNIPMVICDTEHTKISRTLVNYYNTSDKFVVVEQVNTMEELEECLKSGRAKVGVYFPNKTSKTIKYGQTPEVGIYVDATNVVYGNAALSSLEEINTVITVGAAQQVLERVNYYRKEALEAAYPAQLKVRILNNPTNGYTDFMLLGLAANGVQIGIYFYAAALYWKRNELMEYGAGRLLFGKQLAICILALISFLICAMICHYHFYVPLKGSAFDFTVLMAAFVFLFSSLVILFSLIFPNGIQAIQNTLIYIMPGLLFSGLSWPAQACTGIGEYITHIMPITYLGMPLRYLSVKGVAPMMWENIAYMTIAGCVLSLINYLLLKRRVKMSDEQVSAVN